MSVSLTALVTALLSALAAATSSVLQHRSAQAADSGASNGIRLVLHLLLQPLWLLGTLSALVGLALHVVALDAGRLTVVQPLLVSGLLFALPVSVLLERRRPSLAEWSWALVVIVGLSVFLVVADPHGGRAAAATGRLVVAALVGAAVMLLLWLTGRGGRLALPVAAAGGLGFGVTSALLKQCTAVETRGLLALLTSWVFYAMLAVGAASIILTQLAYRSAPLASSLPAMTVCDPAAAVLIGVVAFHERIDAGPVAVVAEVAAFVLMAVGTWQLARRTPVAPV